MAPYIIKLSNGTRVEVEAKGSMLHVLPTNNPIDINDLNDKLADLQATLAHGKDHEQEQVENDEPAPIEDAIVELNAIDIVRQVRQLVNVSMQEGFTHDEGFRLAVALWGRA